jgi:hypothetical protein
VALAPLGWFGYVLWVLRREGDLLGGYFAVQRRWGSRSDLGRGSSVPRGDRLVLSPPGRAPVRTAKARPWHAAGVAGALAGLSLAYGAYLVVIAGTPL